MKKTMLLIGLLLSLCSFSLEEYKYEEVTIARTPKNMKIIKVLTGKHTGLYGIVDNSGKFLTDSNNMLISIQQNYIYLVDADNNEGLMSIDGQWIGRMGEYKYKDKYMNMYAATSDSNVDKKYFIVYNKYDGNNKFGILNINRNILIPLEYDDVRVIADEMVAVKKNNKWGYVNSKGQEVIPFKYDEAFEFINGKALVRIGKDRFYIDKYGNEKICSTFLLNFQEWMEGIKKHISSSFEEKMSKYQ